MRTAIVAEQIQKKKEKRRNMALFIELLLMGVGLAMDAFADSWNSVPKVYYKY